MRKWYIFILLLSSFSYGQNPQITTQAATFFNVTSQTPLVLNVINSGSLYYQISWQVVGGTFGACTIEVDSSANGTSSWGAADVIGAQTCTSNGNFTSTSKTVNYVRLNTNNSLTTGTGTPTLYVTITAYNNNPAGSGTSVNVASYSSGTQTLTVAATTLCAAATCTAGTYEINIYQNETGTGCTSVGSGIVKVGFNYIDNRGVTINETQVPHHNLSGSGYGNGMTLTTTGLGQAVASYTVNTNGTAVAGSDSIQILTTVIACGTPGPWTGYQVRAFVTKVGGAI